VQSVRSFGQEISFRRCEGRIAAESSVGSSTRVSRPTGLNRTGEHDSRHILGVAIPVVPRATLMFSILPTGISF